MSEIEVFSVVGQQCRFGATDDGRPYVVAGDFAKRLGYRDAADALRNVEPSEKGTQIVRTPGGEQRVSVLYEEGIWELIFLSRRPEAKLIKARVKVILREIRETGRFEVEPEKPMSELEMAQRYVAALQREQVLQAQVRELEPDAARARRTMDADGLSLVGTVAKRFGIRERALRDFLHAEGLLIKGGSRHNEPMARFIQSGHFDLKTRLVGDDPDRPPVERSTTFVTPKGEALIWKRLFDAGYVTSPRMPQQQLALI